MGAALFLLSGLWRVRIPGAVMQGGGQMQLCRGTEQAPGNIVFWWTKHRGMARQGAGVENNRIA